MAQIKQSLRVALVTGAAGGLGQGIVAELIAQGWGVAAGCHHQHPFTPTDGLLPLNLDVTQRDQSLAAVEVILGRWGRLDLLVNNAGLTADHLLVNLSETDWDRVLEVNLKGAFFCAQAALKPMLDQRAGHIISISSFAARQGARGQANYAAAKAGLIALTQSLAREVGARNICVNAVLPGLLRTAMTAALTAAQLTSLAQANMLGRLNEVAEVARFIAFLAGTHNISGQVFQLDSRIGRWT